jgi:diguanylate cyclase (GGDEF)-like protein
LKRRGIASFHLHDAGLIHPEYSRDPRTPTRPTRQSSIHAIRTDTTMPAAEQPARHTELNPGAAASPFAALRRALSRATEPQILYPAIAVVLLAVIWGTTLNLIRVELAAARSRSAVSSQELGETYEAQVVRALREIDQTLKFVKYTYELGGNADVLNDLKARNLLPPGLLFVVSIANAQGQIIASSRPRATSNFADRDFFRALQVSDSIVVSRPRQLPDSGEWTLEFSRRLDAPGGGFAGIVTISVPASYFVSGYEPAKLGQHGLLGLLGADGIFRAMRSGKSISAGKRVEYPASLIQDADTAAATAAPTTFPDGVPRYLGVHELYDFPLAVIVGLSVEEQLADTHRDARNYLWRAAAGSLLLILILGVMGHLSRQLAISRARTVEQHIAQKLRAEHQAYHDSLTGLPNRSLFARLLSQSLSQAQRYQRRLAVLFLDLDGFKGINDTLGHDAGDELLKEVAQRLQACLRESDTVARLGGDEFIVLLPELGEDAYAATVALKILQAIKRPFLLHGRPCGVTGSIGISLYPQDGLDEETLTRHADAAM